MPRIVNRIRGQGFFKIITGLQGGEYDEHIC